MYSPGGYGVLHAEVDIVRDARRETDDILPMRITEFLRPFSQCVGPSWLPVLEGFIHWGLGGVQASDVLGEFGRAEEGEAWLESPEVRKRACECCVRSLLTGHHRPRTDASVTTMWKNKVWPN